MSVRICIGNLCGPWKWQGEQTGILAIKRFRAVCVYVPGRLVLQSWSKLENLHSYLSFDRVMNFESKHPQKYLWFAPREPNPTEDRELTS